MGVVNVSERLTDDEVKILERIANSDKPWANAIDAYLTAVQEFEKPQS